MASTVGMKVSYTECEIRDLLSSPESVKKKFVKKRCGQCNAPFKNFKGTSPLIIRGMISSFWCRDCGRLLCEAHRNQHVCERVDAKRAAERRLTIDEIRERAKKEDDDRKAAEALEKQKKRAATEARAAKIQFWKDRRIVMANKSSHVANFVQRLALQGGADELLQLYTTCNRLNLHLQNEINQPTSTLLDIESWAKLREAYDRVKDLTGLLCVVDGMPLDLDDQLPDHIPRVGGELF